MTKRLANPKPRGGARPGAGRPKGKAVLPYGASAAIKALRHRVPKGTPEPLAEVADEAFAAVVDVMRKGWVAKGSTARLQAAAAVREEICGPMPKQVAMTGADGGPLTVVFKAIPDDIEGER